MTSPLRRTLGRIHRRLLPDDPEIGWTPYLWLTYFVFYYVPYLFMPVPAAELALAVLGGALFLVLYFLAYHSRGARFLACIAGITMVGLVLFPTNPLGGTFFIYACAFAAQLKGRPAVLAAVLIVLASATVEWSILGLSGWFLMPVLVFGPMVALINRFQAEQARKRRDLRLSHDEVRRLAATAERERIGRDLHDLLGHTLSLITLKAELAGKLIGRDATAAETEIAELERISREALKEVREAVTGFRAADLATELANARLALEVAGIEFSYDPPPSLPADLDHTLAMCLREAITNVVRHSGASLCRVRLDEADGLRVMTVRDDGRGGLAEEGSGIRGMRERVEAVGGRLEVVDGDGLRLRIGVPLGQDREPLLAEDAA